MLKIEDDSDASEGKKTFTFELKKVHSFHSQNGLIKNTEPVLSTKWLYITFFSGNEIIYSNGESDTDEDYEPIAKKTKKQM